MNRFNLGFYSYITHKSTSHMVNVSSTVLSWDYTSSKPFNIESYVLPLWCFYVVICLALDSSSSNYKKEQSGFSAKISFCVPQNKINKFEFGMTRGTVNDDRTSIFGRTIPLTTESGEVNTCALSDKTRSAEKMCALSRVTQREKKKMLHQTGRDVPDDISL